MERVNSILRYIRKAAGVGFGDNEVMVSYSERTEIKILNPQGIACEAKGCEELAAFLFRTGDGPINAYCELHASQAAVRLGVDLPERSHRVLRAGWSF